MKKTIFLISLLLIFTYSISVFAKDTVISMNKYKEEKFNYITDSYDKDGKKDGKVVGGSILFKEKTDDEEADYRVIIVKYNKDTEIEWKYIYDTVNGDYIDSLNYSYDTEGKINGYLITMHSTSTELSNTIFIKLSLEGKVVEKKDFSTTIIKIKKTYTDEGIIDGYIAIANTNDTGYLLKLDCDLNIIWQKEYPTINMLDVEKVINNQKIVGYVTIMKKMDTEDIQLVRFDIYGDNQVIINEKIDSSIYHLEEASEGFIIYGDTTEVKLSKGTASYYLINYNSSNENYWETIGDVPIDRDKIIKMIPIKKDNQIKEYLLAYSNDNVDTNLEVVRIGLDGEIKNKIKKIQDEYYDIEDFKFSNDILYLVGQINCPKDDTCEYDSNSLLLVSDEEKVIEVKDNDSRNILIITGIFIVMIIGTVLIRKRNMSK